jgi:translation initiation factor 1
VGSGDVRVQHQSKGRNGKVVTVISGLPLIQADLTRLSKELKTRCGCGGTAKEGTIEIQGAHRELIIEELRKRGFSAKAAGGR